MTARSLPCSATARASALVAVVLAAAWSSPAAADDAPEVRILARDGAIVVASDAAVVTVLVADRPRGVVTPGTSLSISLPEGTHRIAIDVAGYQRYERAIAIQLGKTASLRATLAALPPSSGSPPVRIALVSPYEWPPGAIDPRSPYGPPPAAIDRRSPNRAPPPAIELTSPYGPPPGAIDPRSPYGPPAAVEPAPPAGSPSRIELISPYESPPPPELSPGAPAPPDRRPGATPPAGPRPGRAPR